MASKELDEKKKRSLLSFFRLVNILSEEAENELFSVSCVPLKIMYQLTSNRFQKSV